MKSHILHLYTHTPLHVGAGSSVGVVDQPVQRERHTGFPVIPGSSIKGVMRDHFQVPVSGNEVFGMGAGKDDAGSAGLIGFSEAKLLLFPVRSSKGCYAMVTCPLALARYSRDNPIGFSVPATPKSGECLSGENVTIGSGDKAGVVLEEYSFKSMGSFPQEWVNHLVSVLGDTVLKNAEKGLVLLPDEDFAHFAQYACQIQHHNRIDPDTGTVANGALFNEETVPSETLFYGSLVETRRSNDVDGTQAFLGRLKQGIFLQIGGNSTTGQGYCFVKLTSEEGTV